jgi:hypothetical protein
VIAVDEKLREMELDALTAENDREVWKPCEDISSVASSAPSMPIELVPGPFRAHVGDVADRMNVPIEMLAVPLVTATAAVIGRRIALRPKAKDDWEVKPILWGAVVARSGALKSPAMQEALRPIRRLEAQKREQWAKECGDRKHKLTIIDLEAKATELEITRALRKNATIVDLTERLRAKREEAAKLAVPEPRLMTNDPTVEKLAELLCGNPRGMMVVRDELTGWLRSHEKPGREGDRQFYLEGWNGTGAYVVDRIGRGTISVPALSVCILGTTQPGPMKAYIVEAMADGMGADGLLQRFGLLVWSDGLPAWRNVDRKPDTLARDHAFEIIRRLDGLDVTGCEKDSDDSLPFLRFDDEAQQIFDDFRDDLEKRLRSPELLAEPALESCLAKHRSLLPALALVFHLLDSAGANECARRVTARAAALAADWCEFLECHARKVYAEGGAHAAARLLAERIEDGEVRHGETVRDVYRREWRGLGTKERVERALADLERIGWVRVEKSSNSGAGRPPSPVIMLHPDLRRAGS